MDIQNLEREFRYNGVVLPDPNQAFSLPQVRDFYAGVYPEIISADIEGPQQTGAKAIYTFRRAVGTKGGRASEEALRRLRANGRLSETARQRDTLTAQQVSDPRARQIKRLLDEHRDAGGSRCLAPSINHAVLP